MPQGPSSTRKTKISLAPALDFTLVPAQSRAYAKLRPGNVVCNAWGRGTGKSWFARMCMYLLVCQWDGAIRNSVGGPRRGIRIFYMFPTLPHFKRLNHAKNMLEELTGNGVWAFLGVKVDRTEWTFTFPGGSTIQVLSAEVSNRGARADVAVLDEADEIPISTYEAEVMPWFTEPWSLNIRLITGTPLRARYGLLWKGFSVWPHGDVKNVPAAGHYSFSATVYDADPSVVNWEEVRRAKGTISPTRFSTEYLCNFDSGEGLVYPFFSVDFHVRTPPSFADFHTFLVGVDYGFEDPSVFLVIGIAGRGRDAICHALHEEYMVGKSGTELAAVARSLDLSYPDAYWYADHNPALTKQIHDDARVRIVAADKSASVEAGVAFVADAIFVRTGPDGSQWSQLYVDPSCKHTIDEFGKYRRKRDARNPDRVLDAIDTSRDDHCLDSLRYALVSHFVGPERRLEKQQKLRAAAG